MTMRYDRNKKIGDPGVEYEFKVKIYKLDAPKLDDVDFEMERDMALEQFSAYLMKRYKWISEMYFTGRSGGWLAIRDHKGRPGGATYSKLETIDKLVEEARRAFIKYVEREYA